MKLLLVLLATACASGLGHEPVLEPQGYEQSGFDYSYGSDDRNGYPNIHGSRHGERVRGLILETVPYLVGRQGIGFTQKNAYAFGFDMPPTADLLKILKRDPKMPLM